MIEMEKLVAGTYSQLYFYFYCLKRFKTTPIGTVKAVHILSIFRPTLWVPKKTDDMPDFWLELKLLAFNSESSTQEHHTL